MLAVFTPANTWLFDSAYTFVPSVTRAPIVPVATPLRPVETPIGTGLGYRCVGAWSNGWMTPVVVVSTGTPSRSCGRSATSARSL